MALYAVIGLDHPPHSMPKRDAVRAAHRTYVLEHDQAISLAGVLLGEENNQCGSLYLFEADSEQSIRDWLAKEPFYQSGVYAQVVIRRFYLGLNKLTSQSWPITGRQKKP
jgi:uncharacterized protein YciI